MLEHKYGATLLAHLLAGDPIPVLGDDATPASVRFQASSISPVDDLLVKGSTPDGEERRVSIGVRRTPSLRAGDQPSIQLLTSYLRVVVEDWDEVRAGRQRLGLAVATPNPAVRQLGELCLIARSVPNDAAFRTEVGRPRRTNKAVRGRLKQIDTLVQATATAGTIQADTPSELTWRLLSALSVTELRLEGADLSDRTAAVGRLRTLTADQTAVAADALFSRLAELAGQYASSGAEVTEALLRRDLSGTALSRSPSHAQAWGLLDGLSARLRDRTGFSLSDPNTNVELERREARETLSAHMMAAAERAGALVVVGEPDVGKSALTLRGVEDLEAAGAVATSVSLRDLPATTLELEALLDGRLTDVLAGMATGAGRVLVVDGAEAVLEGRAPLLVDVATAGLRAGVGVVAVTRRDGARAVAEALRRAASAAGAEPEPAEHNVPGLTDIESESLVSTFSTLSGLAGDPRSAWLLMRPGLVDLLLRAGAALALPPGPLSEADLFAVIWGHLVRRGETTSPGASPDARDRALTSLARRLLLPQEPGEAPPADALPSLRSDGLLLPPGPTSAWNPMDQFASDLVRDLALARLLIIEGWGVLDRADAPRWTLRAVRVACQAALNASGPDSERERVAMQARFEELAEQHGARWSEVPLEALLTLGSAPELIARARPALCADDRSQLRTLLRLGIQRYSEAGFGDHVALAPLVALAYCGDDDLGQHDPYGRHDVGEQIRELVLAWLRGLIQANAGPLDLRKQVRDRLLAAEPEPYDEFAVEALAMLGPDLDAQAETFLSSLAADGGSRLAPAVEAIGPVLAMSEHQPDLLVSLTEAFYISKRDEAGGGWSSLDDGIRRHQKTGGMGVPMAAWYFGPFFRLLNTRPAQTIAMINRLLDHAARVRVRKLGSLRAEDAGSAAVLPGLDLELPGIGTRHCVGDAHVWSWYRGSSVGPYPCMSALLATERFADHLIDGLRLPVSAVTELLLRDCHNLAMPGLVVGLLVRHFDEVDDLLDRWLTRPELWHLEFSRVMSEGQLHVQGPDQHEVVGRDRRKYTFRDVAAQMTITAMVGENSARLAALEHIADDLVRHAREELDVSDANSAEVATVEGWAATFRPENYESQPRPDGNIVVEYQHPEKVEAALAPSMASLSRGNEALRLQMTYGRSEDRVATVDTLTDDLKLARDIALNPPAHGLDPRDSVAAVGSAAIVAHAQGRAAVPGDDLRWAAEILVEAAMHAQVDALSFESTTYPWGAERSAAAALPLLLLPAFDGLGIDRERLEQALRCSATSMFDEVRTIFALGLRPLWTSACEPDSGMDRCRHQMVWEIVEEGVRDCRLGDRDPAAERRLPDPLDPPVERSLRKAATDRLLVNRLTHPLIASADAARSQCCIAGAADRLLNALYDAHRRGSGHWAREGYGDFNNPERPRVARVLLESAAAGESAPLTEYVRDFASNAPALTHLLRDLAVLFTYDDGLRHALPVVWREVLTTALDALDAGAKLFGDRHWSDTAIAGLIPTPELEPGDSDPDTSLKEAERMWLAPDTIGDLVGRWIPYARREPKAVDAVVRLARSAPPAWQATTGLSWVEDLIDGRHDVFAQRCWFLADWLEIVRSSHLGADGTKRWRRIVDGLAAEGDRRAVRLQMAEE